MSGAAKSISSVAFSPGGPTLAAAGRTGTVRLWDLDVNYAIKRICADTNRRTHPATMAAVRSPRRSPISRRADR